MKLWLGRAVVLVVALLAWEAVARNLDPILYVGPSRLPAALGRVMSVRDLPPLGSHLWLTLGEVVVAFLLAVASGLWVGFVLGLQKTLGRIYEPLLAVLYAVPLHEVTACQQVMGVGPETWCARLACPGAGTWHFTIQADYGTSLAPASNTVDCVIADTPGGCACM